MSDVGVMGVENPSALGNWLVVRGINPDAPAPLVSLLTSLVPNAMYGYDPALLKWTPMLLSGGAVIEVNSALIAAILSNVSSGISDVEAAVDAGTSELRKLVAGVTISDTSSFFAMANALGYRKVVGIDAGAVAATTVGALTVSFSGVNLSGRASFLWNETERKVHWITSAITDPSGATLGSFSVFPAIGVASATLRIPYATTPHAYEMLSDDLRTRLVSPAPAKIAGPVQPIAVSLVGVNPDTASIDIPVIDYAGFTLGMDWTCPASGAVQATWRIDIYARLDDNAAGTAVWHLINELVHIPSSHTQLGVDTMTGRFLAAFAEAGRIREFRITRTGVAGTAAQNNSMSGWYILGKC